MKDPRISLIRKAFEKLLRSNGKVTNLEIKVELRTEHPFYRWEQDFISAETASYADLKGYTFTFNGTFRTYIKKAPTKTAIIIDSIPSSISTTISKKKALEMLQKSGGRFVTVEFLKTNKKTGKLEPRILNGQYIKDQKASPLGYVLMKESDKLKVGKPSIRNVNLQTLKSVRMGGITYRVR